MKRVVASLGIIGALAIISGADFRRTDEAALKPMVPSKKPCYGYTIIEFGVGINCDGDTVKLQKVQGGQQLAHTP